MPIYKQKNKSKDGKQAYKVRVNFTDANGNYQTKTKTVYGAAEAKMVEMELLAAADADKTYAGAMTVGDLCKEYLTAKKSEVKITSYVKDEGTLRLHILPYFEKVKLDKLNKKNLQEWKNEIYKKEYSHKTNQRLYATFRTLLNYAVKMEYLSGNPLTKLGNFKEVYFEKPQDKICYYTAEEFRKFIDVAKKYRETVTRNGYYVFFNIAFFTGMRKGEINALKWTDIEGNIIHVRRTVSQKIKGTPVLETPPKTYQSYRDIQIPKKLIDILEEHKKLQMSALQFTEDYRVCGGDTTLADSSIENMNIKYGQEAGLKHITIHGFRHSHASLLANEGINIQEISRRLGHANVELTWNTYSHLYPREEERAISVLDAV